MRFLEDLQLLEHLGAIGAYCGALAAITLWGFEASQIAVLASTVFAGLALCLQIWATVRRDRRETEQHEARKRDKTKIDKG